ncbi:hypothetical protein M9458_039418, partial [Cirrhinus mrigala]
ELKKEGSKANGEVLGRKRPRLTERFTEDMDSSMEIAEEDDEDYVSSLHLFFIFCFQIFLASDVWVGQKEATVV